MRMKRQAGFTLIEMAVVVFLIGLLATMGISALKAQLASAAISATKKKQDTIKDALIAYLGKNRRLPCPATDNSGREGTAGVRLNQISPNCPTYFGIVPYVDLGLPKSAALDGWENFFSYAVSQQWTATLLTTTAPTAGGSTTNNAVNAFNVGNTGALTINDRIPTSPYTTTPTSTNTVIVVISHGKNGSGAYTVKGTWNASATAGTDESANDPTPASWSDPHTTFFQREYTEVNVPIYGAFDDVVTLLTPNDLLTPLIKDGSIKSPYAQWADQIYGIKNAQIGDMISTCKAPNIPTTATYAIDPWGNFVGYTKSTTLPLNQSLKLADGGNTYASSYAYSLSVVAPNPSAPSISGPSITDVFGNSLAWNQTCP